MTETQVAVFMEERKWDYRSMVLFNFFSFRLVTIRPQSFWVCSSTPGGFAYRWVSFHGLEPGRGSYVGPWCVVDLFVLSDLV